MNHHETIAYHLEHMVQANQQARAAMFTGQQEKVRALIEQVTEHCEALIPHMGIYAAFNLMYVVAFEPESAQQLIAFHRDGTIPVADKLYLDVVQGKELTV